MKRSTLAWWAFILYIVEFTVAGVGLNEKFKFVNSTLEAKYDVLTIAVYMLSLAFMIGFVMTHMDDGEAKTKQKYLWLFGKTYVNPLYTWHFLFFAAVCFYLSFWPWCIAGVLFFWITNVHRSTQNGYSEDYELEELKEQAKTKPVVVLDKEVI